MVRLNYANNKSTHEGYLDNQNHKGLKIDPFCGFCFGKKGFTLVEIIGAIVLLTVIGLIIYPVINNLISDSKDDLYKKQIEELERISNTWVTKNYKKLKLEAGYSYNLSFEELKEAGLISEQHIKNPKTGELLEGCITLSYNSENKNYDIKYDSKCQAYGETKHPTIVLSTNSGVINGYGYATSNFDVVVSGSNITSYMYCKGKYECEPDTKVESSSGIIPISNNGTTYVCAIGTNEFMSSEKVCKVYKLDKTKPEEGELVIDGTLGENGWYVSDVKLSVRDVEGVTSTLNITEITRDTSGTEIIMTSKNNKTGAVKVTNYTVKVDKTKPTVGELVINGIKGNNGWYKSDVVFSVVNGNDTLSGHADTISSIASITSDTKGTKVIVTTKDKAGNTSTKEYIVKVDKTKPTIGELVISGTKGNNGWYKSNVTFSVINGSDSTSGHATTSSTHTSIITDTKGTKVILTTKDKAGNTSTKEYTIKVDKTAPTIEMVNPSNGNWTNQNIEITSNFSDSVSGIVPSSLAWSDDNTNWHNYSNTRTTTFKDTWSGEGNRTGYNKVCDYAGNCSTTSTPVRIDKTAPTIPTVTYNSGSNSCSWKNNYNLTLNSSDSLSGVRVYQVDWTGDSASNSDVTSNFIPWNGYSSCNNRFRAVDNAGNASEWTGVHHIHMDTEKPVHTNWWWGTVDANIAQLYIQATDNVGISRVQCPTSTQSGGYGNWRWYDAVWDSSQNAYRCDIKPADFGHYAQTYKTHLYIYDHAGNGGYYDETSAYINKKLYEIVSTNSSCTSYTENYPNTDTNYTTLNLNSGCAAGAQIDLILYNAIKKGDIIKVTYSVTRTGSYYMSILDNQHINNNGGISCDPLCSTQYFKYYISSSGISKTTKTIIALYDTDFYKIGIVKNTYDYTASFQIYDITINGVKVY